MSEVRAAAERLKASAEAWLECNPPPEPDDEWAVDMDAVGHWQDQLVVADACLTMFALLRDFLANNAYSSTADWCDCRTDPDAVCEHMAAHRILGGDVAR